MKMKYAGYSIKKLIEETLKDGFREEPHGEHRHLTQRVFTKWANGIAYKLRWVEIPQGRLFMSAYPEKRRKLTEKKQTEERKRLQLVTEAKRGVNWDEHIIDYYDENFDKSLKELEELSNKVSKKEKNLEQRWDVMKDKIYNRAKDILKKKNALAEVLKEIESEKDVSLYLASTIDLRWKDPICGKMCEKIEAMRETFYNKYEDFISSITLDNPEALTYLTGQVFKARFEHNRFIIQGCSSKKQLVKLLRFIKLYVITFGHELERKGRGRPGYSFRDVTAVREMFQRFYKKFKKIYGDIKKARDLLSKDSLDISNKKKSEIAKKHNVDFKIVHSIAKKNAYETALEYTAIYFKKSTYYHKKAISKWQVIKMIKDRGYENKFKFSD